jgi:hypothetical protein
MEIILKFFKDTFLNEFQTTMTGDRIATGLLVSFLVTLFIVLVYRVTYQGVAVNRSFFFSLVLLSMVTSMVIMTVTTNLTLSLGMVGALSIVRFRTAVKDPSDTVFMFWAIGAGIMAGAGLIYITLITNLSLGILYMLYYFLTKKIRSSPYLLVVRYQLSEKEAVEAALGSLTRMRVKSKTVSSGIVELCLQVKLTPATLSLVDDLAKVQGVLDASAVSYGVETTL